MIYLQVKGKEIIAATTTPFDGMVICNEDARLMDFDQYEIESITGGIAKLILKWAYPERTIRISITDAQVLKLLKDGFKELVDYALAVPRTENGDITHLYFEELLTPNYTSEQIEGLLNAYGIQVERK